MIAKNNDEVKPRRSVGNPGLKLLWLIGSLWAGNVLGQQMTIPEGLIGWWPGDGNCLNGLGTNNGALINGAGFAAGLLGQSFEFHGAGDRVEITNFLYSPENTTIEGWIYPVAAPDGEMIIVARGSSSTARTPLLTVTTNSQHELVVRGLVDSVSNNATTTLTLQATNTIPLNQWTHVAMTLSPENGMRLYLNGQLARSGGVGQYRVSQVWFPDLWEIGGGSGPSFRGRIDEVKLFLRELSANSIQLIYDQERPGLPWAPIVFGFPFSFNASIGDDVHLDPGAVSPGGLPLSYQWLLYGTNLPGKTDSPPLIINNIQANQFGPYQLRVSNALGTVTSTESTIYESGIPPLIVSGLTNVSVELGANVSFAVAATSPGGSPLHYLWQFNWNNLAGETNSTLVLSNVQPIQAGTYRVLASNAFGSASSEATLSIVGTGVTQVVTVGTNNLGGVLNVPPGLVELSAVSAGPPNLALRSDGTVVAWGSQYSEALQVPAGLRAKAISSAGDYSLALEQAGTMTGWGNLPFQTPFWLDNIAAISAGERGGIALRSDRTVTIWNDPEWPSDTTPPVPAGCTNIVAVAAGHEYWLALRSDGAVFAWGNNSFGRTQVPANLRDVVAISAHTFQSLALTAAGTVVAWGSYPNVSTVPAGLSNVVAISAGQHVNLALRDDGTVVAWGEPSFGFPTNALLTVSNAIGVSAGALNGLVLYGNGKPCFTVQPWDLSVIASASPKFVGKVAGVDVRYQWLFNGNPIAGASQDSLVITNAQLPNAGIYTLVASNSFGKETSSNATLTVQLPGQPVFISGAAHLRSDGRFEFGIRTLPGIRLEIQASSNLVDWFPLATFRSISDTVYYTDPSLSPGPRFYRARVVP